MSRSRSATVALFAGLLSPAVGATAAEPAPAPRGPIRPLAEYVRQLKDPDGVKRLLAAMAIRDFYKGKSLAALPQIIEALGEELGKPSDAQGTGRTVYLDQRLWEAADGAGPGRLKVIEECTRHPDPRVRAGAFRAWLIAAYDADAGVNRDEFVAAVRRGLEDDSPLVRGQAVYALRAFRDAPPVGFALPGFRDAPPKVVEEVVLLLATALEDRASPQEGVDSPAVQAALVLDCFKASAKPAITALVKAAATATEDDILVAGMACRTLQTIGRSDPKAAEDIVTLLRPLLRDRRRPDSLRAAAVSGLFGVGPSARWAIPELADILEEPHASSELRTAAYTALGNMGPRAAPAVSTLIKRLERATDEQELTELFYTLKAIGPAAAPAIEAIEKWIDKAGDQDLRKKAYAALVAIKA